MNMLHRSTLYGILILGSLSSAALAQTPGIYLKIGAQFLEAGGKKWGFPKGPDGNPENEGHGLFPVLEIFKADSPFNRAELGGEWVVSPDFGLRAGFAAARIQPDSYGWRQGFLDVLYTPWRRGRMRAYASAGLGLGSFSSTYVVREEDWVMPNDATTPLGSPYLPGDYRSVSQSSRPFLRASAGFQLNRYFAVEANGDVVYLKSGKGDPWPSSVVNAGFNFVLRIPFE